MNKNVLMAGISLPVLLSLGGCLSSGGDSPQTNTAPVDNGSYVKTRGDFLLGTTASAVKAACDQATSEYKTMEKDFLALPSETPVETLLAKKDAANHLLNTAAGAADLQANTAENAAVRDAAGDCATSLETLSRLSFSDPAAYDKLAAIPAQRTRALSQGSSYNYQLLLTMYREGGAHLRGAARDRAADIEKEMSALAAEFQKNINADGAKTVAIPAADVEGIDPAFLGTLQKDATGNYLFKLNYPSRDNIMEYAVKESTRKAFYLEFMKRGGPRNIEILDKLSELRLEKAKLNGKTSFAELTLANRMAGTPEKVSTFLEDIHSKVLPLEKAEVDALTALKRKQTGVADAKLERWDQAFYQALDKKQNFQLDQTEVRKQFPTKASVDWMLLVSSKLYDVSFKPNTKVKTWHPDVLAYDVLEGSAQPGAYIGTFYMDLFPRDGKYGHAAAWPVQPVSTQLGKTPISVLVTNFDRTGLNQNELETLFHEFGHVLHGVLSKARYSWHAGTSVARDFVEAPSQMYEEWSRREETLKLFNEACKTCQPIDMKLVEKMKAGNNYAPGLSYNRQWSFATFDMSLVGKDKVKAMDSWKAIEGGKTTLGHVDGTLFPAGFGHLAGGYAAGYYGYMWSEVLAMDMLSKYGNNVMDTKVAKRYRSIILERGGEKPAAELVKEFLEREPNNEAFIKQITGQNG